MIESLMEIQIAYNMMDVKTSEDSMLHPLDTHYFKLNCAIDVYYLIYNILICFPLTMCFHVFYFFRYYIMI